MQHPDRPRQRSVSQLTVKAPEHPGDRERLIDALAAALVAIVHQQTRRHAEQQTSQKETV